MDKEFESWWTINKFSLMENVDVGLREIALAAFLAGRQTAQQSVYTDEGYCVHDWSFPPEFCPVCNKRVPLIRLRG